MNINRFTYLFLSIICLLGNPIVAQEELNDSQIDSLVKQVGDDDFQIPFFKAISERGIEEYEKAIEILTKLEKDYKQEPSIYFQLGLNYYDLENFGKALNNLEKADALKPNDVDISEALFKVYEQQKDYPKAKKYATILANSNPEYYEILSNIYFIEKQYIKALNALDKADEKQGFDVHKDALRALIYKNYNKLEVARAYYKKRIELEPYNPINAYRLVENLIMNSAYDEAIQETMIALDNNPRFTRFYVLQTKLFFLQNQPQKGFDALKVVVSDRFLEEKYKVEAINYAKSYVETHSEYQDDFIAVLNTATETAEDSASYLDLGLYYFEKDKSQSLANFKKALEQNPQSFEILKYISVLQYQLSQYDEAISTADKALEIFPTQAYFMLIKGESLLMQTQYNASKSVLLEALSYVFEENELMLKLYEALSQAYLGLNEIQKAQDYNDKAKKLQSKLN